MVILPVKVLCSTELSFIMYYCSGAALLHCIRLHCSNLHLNCRAYPRTAPYSTELHWNCDALHCTALNYTELHWTTLQCTLPHCTALHWTTLYCPALHSPALSCTALHLDILHCTALHMLYWYQRKFNKEIIMSYSTQNKTFAHWRCKYANLLIFLLREQYGVVHQVQ